MVIFIVFAINLLIENPYGISTVDVGTLLFNGNPYGKYAVGVFF